MDRIWDILPESKLELWDRPLLIRSSLLGSQALLAYLLQTMGVPAVLPLVTLDAWWDALGGMDSARCFRRHRRGQVHRPGRRGRSQ
jgi:hypothetical protein